MTSQSILHHPPFIETNPSLFSLHAPPMQEQQNCLMLGFDGISSYDWFLNGSRNYVNCRYDYPFSELRSIDFNSNCEASKFHQLTQKNERGEDMVLELKKALYGTKQASRLWQFALRDFLMSPEMGFTNSPHDPCLFSRRDIDGSVILLTRRPSSELDTCV